MYYQAKKKPPRSIWHYWDDVGRLRRLNDDLRRQRNAMTKARNHFCHWIGEIASAAGFPERDTYAPDAVWRKVVSLLAAKDREIAGQQEILKAADRCIAKLQTDVRQSIADVQTAKAVLDRMCRSLMAGEGPAEEGPEEVIRVDVVQQEASSGQRQEPKASIVQEPQKEWAWSDKKIEPHRQHIRKTCNCGQDSCPVCNDWFVCSVCRGVEDELPTECPGRPMCGCIKEQVERGELDFVGGKWMTPLHGLESLIDVADKASQILCRLVNGQATSADVQDAALASSVLTANVTRYRRNPETFLQKEVARAEETNTPRGSQKSQDSRQTESGKSRASGACSCHRPT